MRVYVGLIILATIYWVFWIGIFNQSKTTTPVQTFNEPIMIFGDE